MCGGSFKKEREEAESRAGRARREWGGVGGMGGGGEDVQELEPRSSGVHAWCINVHQRHNPVKQVNNKEQKSDQPG